jgi:3-isopropylmalate dehydrogenase
MTSTLSVLALPGDGIGPEVTGAAIAVLDAAAAQAGIAVTVETDLAGGACYDACGAFLRDETMRRAREVDAILFGSEGGPKWDSLELPMTPTQRSALSRLRKELDLFANIRPVRAYPELIQHTPFREAVVQSADLIILRELTSGIYFGTPRGISTVDGVERAVDTQTYTVPEIARVTRVALGLARSRKCHITSIDKSNVMETGVLWRRTVRAIAEAEGEDIEVEHLYADAFLCDLVRRPARFDVVLADNLFGDLASDAAAPIAGSLGMLPSASLGPVRADGKRHALYEPVHGTAPDIAGYGIANPCAAILSVAMLFEWTMQRPEIARRIESAVRAAITATSGTPDVGGTATTKSVTDAVIRDLARG